MSKQPNQYITIVKLHRVLRPTISILYFHRNYIFTKSKFETVRQSLLHHARQQLIDKELRYLGPSRLQPPFTRAYNKSNYTFKFNFRALGRSQTIYIILLFCMSCVFDKQSPPSILCHFINIKIFLSLKL